MKFESIEANKIFSLAILIEKQISVANKDLKKQNLPSLSVVEYRNELNSYLENIEKQFDEIGKKHLQKSYKGVL